MEEQPIGYIVVERLTDDGQHGIIESGKNSLHPLNGKSVYKAKLKSLIVGRMHSGDENGHSYYLAGRAVVVSEEGKILPIIVRISDKETSDTQKQSNSDFVCKYEKSQIMIGRVHEGDENGYTTFTYASLVVDDKYEIHLTENIEISPIKESAGKWAYKMKGRGHLPMTRMKHIGDENGESTYSFSVYSVFEKNK